MCMFSKQYYCTGVDEPFLLTKTKYSPLAVCNREPLGSLPSHTYKNTKEHTLIMMSA